MHILESSLNKTENYAFYYDEPTDVGEIEVGQLYRRLVKEHGRCVGKIYRDKKDGRTVSVGWVFLKRRKYDDCAKTFLCETWVTLAKSVTRVPERLEVEEIETPVN